MIGDSALQPGKDGRACPELFSGLRRRGYDGETGFLLNRPEIGNIV